MSSSKIELWPEHKLTTVSAARIMRVARALPGLVDCILSKLENYSYHPPSLQGWKFPSGEADTEALDKATLSLDAFCAATKAAFAARRAELGAGVHGDYDPAPHCGLFGRTLLLFEAEEHIVASRPGRTRSLQELCLGLRLFSMATRNFCFKQFLGVNIVPLTQDPYVATVWAAHAPTWLCSPISSGGGLTLVDAAHVTETQRVSKLLVDACVACIDIWRTDPQAGFRRLALESRAEPNDWEKALYVGLALRNRVDAPPVAGGVGRKVGGRFCTPKYSEADALPFMRVAERALRAAVAAAGDRVSPELLDFDMVAYKELDYMCKATGRDGQDPSDPLVIECRAVVGELPKRVKRRSTTTGTLKSLGQQFVDRGYFASRPATAEEVIAAGAEPAEAE